jgi:hypothetical protein
VALSAKSRRASRPFPASVVVFKLVLPITGENLTGYMRGMDMIVRPIPLRWVKRVVTVTSGARHAQSTKDRSITVQPPRPCDGRAQIRAVFN